MIDENLVIISVSALFKEKNGKRQWFVVRQSEEEGWELPKVLVRKRESSPKAVIRLMGEDGGISAKILEEAGRAGGVTTVNGKVLPQRHIYYLMRYDHSAGEVLGFDEYDWLEYARAVSRLFSKRDKLMLKLAKKELIKWKKEREKLKKGRQ